MKLFSFQLGALPLLGALLFIGVNSARSSASGTPITISAGDVGRVTGVVEPGLVSFKGLPYAQTPEGARRWQPPQPLPARSAAEPALDGTGFGPACHNALKSGAASVKGPQGENCLFLNVWTPSLPSPGQSQRMPVLVWLHGGGFLVGSSSNRVAAPPPETLVRSGKFVVVSMNYRLGINGFLAHRAMGLETLAASAPRPNGTADTSESSGLPTGAAAVPAPKDGEYGAGMFGLLDQRAALLWVHEHISHFGGDPSRITVAGSSAGAFSLCFHITHPDTAKLISAAVLKSGMCSFPFPPLNKAFEAADSLASAVGCSKADQVATAIHAAGMSHAELDAALHPWAPLMDSPVGPDASDTSTMLVPDDAIVRRVDKAVDAASEQQQTQSASTTREAAVRQAAALYQEELRCMRGVDSDTLYSAIPPRRGLLWWEGAYWFPVINGVEAPQYPNLAFRQGKIPPHIALMMGTVEDEATLFFLLGAPLYLPQSHVDTLMTGTFGEHTAEALSEWYALRGVQSQSVRQFAPPPPQPGQVTAPDYASMPASDLPDMQQLSDTVYTKQAAGQRDLLSPPKRLLADASPTAYGARVMSDVWHCAWRHEVHEIVYARHVTQANSKHGISDSPGRAGVWLYHLTHTPEWSKGNMVAKHLGAFHGSDLLYMFHSGAERMNAQEKALSWLWMTVFEFFVHHHRAPTRNEVLHALQADILRPPQPDSGLPDWHNLTTALRTVASSYAWPQVVLPANVARHAEPGQQLAPEARFHRFPLPVFELISSVSGLTPRPAVFEPPVCSALLDDLMRYESHTVRFSPQVKEPLTSYLANVLVATALQRLMGGGAAMWGVVGGFTLALVLLGCLLRCIICGKSPCCSKTKQD